jgi:hypothetical protein
MGVVVGWEDPPEGSTVMPIWSPDRTPEASSSPMWLVLESTPTDRAPDEFITHTW